MKSKILLLFTVLCLVIFAGCASKDSDEMSDEVTASASGTEMSDDMMADRPSVAASDQDSLMMRNRRAEDRLFENRRVIKGVQRELEDRGYRVGYIDGIVGPKTKSALKKFQRDANIPVTGAVDIETANSLSLDVTNTARAHESESFAE